MKKIALLILAVAAPFLTLEKAQSADSNICRLNVTPVSFGKYNPFARGDARGNGTITYNCSSNTPISIALERSTGADAFARRMSQGAGGLEYNLYLDAACTLIWGDGTGGSQVYRDPSPSPGNTISVPIYGCIPAGQRSAAMGTYNENFVVTVHF